MFNEKNSVAKTSFTVAWIIIGAMVIAQLIYIILCHNFGAQIQHPVSQEQRIFVRTLFYVMAICTFPLASLLRYILIRLNQTMPGRKNAMQRYLITVIVSQAMMESVGVLGFIMFILGDSFNTLYIFSGLAVLGFFLQRPRQEELQSIVEALENLNR